MIEDFHKICRTCLEEITDYKYLSRYLFNVQYINEEKLRLSEILTACTTIEVLENDNLPKQVCIKCETNILKTFSFQQLCLKSDLILKDILSQSVQPELIELKPLIKIEEASVDSAIQFKDIPSYNTSEQDQVNQSGNKVENENFESSLNESVKDHVAVDEILNEDSGCLVSTGSSLGSDDVNSSEQKHSFYNLNENNEESGLLPKCQIKEETTNQELQTYINENDLSSYHTELLDSQHIVLKPSSISNKCTFEKDQTSNLDEAVNSQLTSVKILKEDNEDERNFRDKGHIESTLYSFSENYKNDLLSNYHAGAHQIDSNELWKEVEDETLQPLFPCEAKGCVACFTTLEDLKEHGKKHFSENNYCKICNKMFAGAKTLSRHMTSKHYPGNKTHLCSECGKLFSRASDLRNHILTHSGEKPFECPKCYKRCARRDALRVHMKTHTGQKDFVCNTCEKRFVSSSLLTLHTRIHTGEKPYSCNTCGKSFPDHSRLRVHIRSHSGEKPYVCIYCGKEYATSGHLKTHARIHTGEKPFPCNLCTEKFRRNEHLKTHTIKVHTGEREFICDVCHKGFIQKAHLKAHILSHIDARNHICNICKKGFKHEIILKTHMRTHTGEKPYKCNVCNKAYSQRSTRWNHMKLHKRKGELEAHE